MENNRWESGERSYLRTLFFSAVFGGLMRASLFYFKHGKWRSAH